MKKCYKNYISIINFLQVDHVSEILFFKIRSRTFLIDLIDMNIKKNYQIP